MFITTTPGGSLSDSPTRLANNAGQPVNESTGEILARQLFSTSLFSFFALPTDDDVSTMAIILAITL
jgi:hypothetical protein